jgi:hypothetical protein
MLNNAPGRRILLPKVVAPALSPKTKVPVFFEGEWIELSIGDWSDLKVWGRAETSVLCWTGYRLEKIPTKPPRILSEIRNLTDIKTTANVIRTSHETQFLSLPGSGTVQVQEYMHPLVSGVTLRGASTLKFGDGNPIANAEMEIEKKKIKTDDKGVILEAVEEIEQEDEDKTAELQKQVDELTTENNDLKAKITELEAGKTQMSAEVEAAKKVALEMAEEMKKGIKPEEGKKKSYEEMSNKEKALYNRGKL